ncbi:MAG: 30S ribosomal protein S2, partial [Gammaproteobacteria bacterium]
TLLLFQEALNYLGTVAANNGRILFVGTKRAAQQIIMEQAMRCRMPYVNHRWLGGMLTNYKTVRQSVKRLKELEEMRDKTGFEGMIKKEALQLTRQLEKLQRGFSGIKEMGGLPDVLFVVDVGYEKIAVQEAKRLKIPVVGIVDTNNSPEGVDYIIPGNDDAMRAIDFYVQHVVEMIMEAKANNASMAEEKQEKTAPTVIIETTKSQGSKKSEQVVQDPQEGSVQEPEGT